ncbi:hypothetical protein GCM10020001_063630 [Nonomuraea salmonea]
MRRFLRVRRLLKAGRFLRLRRLLKTERFLRLRRFLRAGRFPRAGRLEEAVEVVGQFGGLHPGARLLVQQAADRRAEPAGLAQGVGLGGEYRELDRLGVAPAERRPTLQRRVERGAERPQIGRLSGRVAVQPLGRHEVERSDELPEPGERGAALDGGDAEVHQHHLAGGAVMRMLSGFTSRW